MLEQLFNLVKNGAEQEIINNPMIPNEENNHAVGMATDAIFNGLQGSLASGGLKDVLGMFAGKSGLNTANPLVGGIVNNLVGGLTQKFGLDSQAAGSIASSLIPSVLGKMVSKTNDPADPSFDMNGIIGSLTGGSSSQGSPVELPGLAQAGGSGIDFSGILKSMTGGSADSDRDGSFGLDDLSGIIGKLAGGNSDGGQAAGGGVLNLLKGFMQ